MMAAVTAAFFTQAKAQCLVHVKYIANKMEIYDSTMTLTSTKDDGQFVFETTEKGFTGTHDGNDEEALHGTLKTLTCNWGKPFIDGKIVMVCDVDDNHEHIDGATITIEAIDKKITILMHAKEYPDRIIKLIIDSYEEVK